MTLQVWNPKEEPNLSRWLRELKTEGLICSDACSPYRVALEAEGIWVRWNQGGEVHEVVQGWLESSEGKARIGAFETREESARYPLKAAWQPG